MNTIMVMGHTENIFFNSGLRDLYDQVCTLIPVYSKGVSFKNFQYGFYNNNGNFPGNLILRRVEGGLDGGRFTLDQVVEGDFRELPIVPASFFGQQGNETIGESATRVMNQGYID